MGNSAGNNIDIKKVNRNKIYQYIYRNTGMISKQDIVTNLNISLPTVNLNLKYLREQKYIVESGTFESTGGRKPKAIAYNPDIRYAIGLDVSKDHVIIALIDLSSCVRLSKQFSLSFSTEEAYFVKVGRLVKEIIIESMIDQQRILGVGIVLPVIVSKDNRSIYFGSISDVGFEDGHVERFGAYIDFPCLFCNDANAGGFAELWAADYIENAFYLSLNNTVGGAVLLNNEIYYGENQRSGEIGHVTLIDKGRTCYCGKQGCVDAYCSALLLSNSANGSLREFFQRLKNGSLHHLNIWNEYLYNLAQVINNLRMLYDCNIILGGYVGAYLDDFLDQIKEMVTMRNTYDSNGDYISICKYKSHATAVGAALQFIDEFIKTI